MPQRIPLHPAEAGRWSGHHGSPSPRREAGQRARPQVPNCEPRPGSSFDGIGTRSPPGRFRCRSPGRTKEFPTNSHRRLRPPRLLERKRALLDDPTPSRGAVEFLLPLTRVETLAEPGRLPRGLEGANADHGSAEETRGSASMLRLPPLQRACVLLRLLHHPCGVRYGTRAHSCRNRCPGPVSGPEPQDGKQWPHIRACSEQGNRVPVAPRMTSGVGS